MNFNMWWPIGLVVLSNVFYHICSKSMPSNLHPFAGLTITYLVAAVMSLILFFVMEKNGNLLQEYRHVNWTSFVLGIAIIGLEVGTIFVYKAGWSVNTAQLIYSSILAIILIFVGYFLFKEQLTPSKFIGILICMIGLYFINK